MTQVPAQVSAEWWCGACSVVFISSRSRGGVLQLRGNPVRGANPRRPAIILWPFPCERAPTPLRGQGSLARSPIPIIRPAGCAS